MKRQTQYYINGLILLMLGLFSITIVPVVVKSYVPIRVENYLYVEFEFFFLTAAALFFLFAPKYYKNQLISILTALLYFILFSKIYLAVY